MPAPAIDLGGTVFGLRFTAALCVGVTLPWIAVAALQWIAGRLRAPKDGGAQALG